MVRLPASARAWDSADFETILKQEVRALGLEYLPLQKGLQSGSVALDRNLDVMVLDRRHGDGHAVIRLGLFYSGIVAGCSCADDPTPVDEVSEYCEVEITLDLASALASFALL